MGSSAGFLDMGAAVVLNTFGEDGSYLATGSPQWLKALAART